MKTLIPYANSLIRDAVLLLEADPDVDHYAAVTVPFQWSMDLKPYQRNIPLQYIHGVRGKVLLDVGHRPKASGKVSNRHAWNRESHFIEMRAKALGYTLYEAWNAANIRSGHRLKNAKLIITRQASSLNEQQISAVRLIMRCANGTLMLNQLVNAIHPGSEAEPVIFSLLARGTLRLVDPDQKLDGEALIAMGENDLENISRLTRQWPGAAVKMISPARSIVVTNLKRISNDWRASI